MARGRRKQLERMDKMETLDLKEKVPYFTFRSLPLSNEVVLSVKNLAVGYQEPVLTQIDFEIKGGQKVVITGFNGIGKSTLPDTLTGKLPAIRGQFKIAEQARIGYFEQEFMEKWNRHGRQEATPFTIVAEAHSGKTVKEIRQQLARCGITERQALQPVETLSGGEQARVKLCLLTLTSCNFLILDEPTNHLDIQAKAAIKDALAEFPGTVLLVTHETSFYQGWVQIGI